jgi:2-dehydropantoate 2-reductase
MRIIVYGIGAIGGTVAAALALSGQEVIGIARGAQLDAINKNGLRLRTPDKAEHAHFECVSDPTRIDFRPDDMILLTMKTQDAIGAMDRLRVAGVQEQAIFCVQNGVANERFALRRFPNVHGVTVMMPADYAKPGEVTAFSTPRHGVFDIGRFPSGRDEADAGLAAALEKANIAAFVTNDVMRSKYGKLLLNLRNILEAALGVGGDTKPFERVLRSEAEAVFEAAGIAWNDLGEADPRRNELMRSAPVPGASRSGSSSTQSLARGAGSIETDYLNGEIALIGRLHGIPVPANSFFVALSARMISEKLSPGAFSGEELMAGLAAAGASME